jgi:hypothetical protein
MNKQIYNYGDQKPFFVWKHGPTLGQCTRSAVVTDMGITGLGNPLSAFAMERHGQKIHVINYCNFSLAAAVDSWGCQYAGGDSGRPKWKTTTSLIGTNVTGGVGQNGPKVLWTCHRLLGHSGNGSNCHIATVGPRFWGTNVWFWGGRTVCPLLDLVLDYFSLGLTNSSQIVTRTKRASRTVTRKKHWWTKHQGTVGHVSRLTD